MLGQDSTSDVTALLQAQVGTFLQLKSQLLEMQRSPVLTISDKASQLLATQNQLESELPAAVEKSQSSDLSDLISAGGFYILMEKQIYDVGKLKDDYVFLGDSAKASWISGVPNWLLYAGGAFVVWRIIR